MHISKTLFWKVISYTGVNQSGDAHGFTATSDNIRIYMIQILLIIPETTIRILLISITTRLTESK